MYNTQELFSVAATAQKFLELSCRLGKISLVNDGLIAQPVGNSFHRFNL